ncbi:MAG: hypothetical protein ISS48_02675 [Candidatus Aenigmarchaeota archaeon]|nr:hypothetical protein [Candidatus Aenigmarchaeota archaeon]
MTASYSLVNMSVRENKNITTFYWLNVPPVLAGRYTGNITVFANKSGS